MLARVSAGLPAESAPRFLTPLLYGTEESGGTLGSQACSDIESGNNSSPGVTAQIIGFGSTKTDTGQINLIGAIQSVARGDDASEHIGGDARPPGLNTAHVMGRKGWRGSANRAAVLAVGGQVPQQKGGCQRRGHRGFLRGGRCDAGGSSPRRYAPESPLPPASRMVEAGTGGERGAHATVENPDRDAR